MALFLITVLVVFAICMLIEVLNGKKHGIIRSGVTFGCILLSIVLGVVIAKAISASVAPVIIEVLNSIESIGEIKELIPSFDSVGSAYIQMLVAPILFIFTFLLIRLIFSIVETILFHTALKNLPGNPKNEAKEIKEVKAEEATEETATEEAAPEAEKEPVNPEADNRPFVFRKTKLFGALIGILSAFFVVVALVAPFKGTLTVVQPVTTALAESDSEEQPLLGEGGTETVKGIVDGGVNDPLGSFTYALGGKAIYNSLSSAKIDGKNVKLANEIEQIGVVAADFIAVAPALTSDAEITDAQVEKMEGLSAKVGNSETLKVLLSEFLSNASEKWLNGEKVLNTDKPSVGEIADPMVDSMLGIFKTSTKENIEGDLDTVFNVVAKLAKSGVLGDTDDFQKLLTNIGESGVLGEIYKDLQSNERMSVLVGEIKNIGLRALASAINIPTDKASQYNDLMGGLSDSLNEIKLLPADQQTAVLAGKINDLTTEYGVDVPAEVADEVATALIKDFGDKETIDAQAVEEFFKVYAASSTTGEAKAPVDANGFDRLANENKDITFDEDGHVVLPDGTVLTYYTKSMLEESGAYNLISENAGDLATLSSAENMKSCIMTLEDILKAANSAVDVDPDKEAELLNQLVKAATKIVDITSQDSFEISDVMSSLGDMLDTISDSDLFGGDAASSLMTAILQSPTVSEITGFTAQEAYDLAKTASDNAGKEGNSYVTSLQSVSDAVEVVKAVSDNNMTDEEIQAKIKNLIDNLTPDNANVLEKLIRPSLLSKYGVPDENVNSLSDMITRLFQNMAAFKGTDAENERESAAIKKLFDMAMSCKDNSGKRAFNDNTSNGILNQTADEFVESFAGSEVVSMTLNESAYKEGELVSDPLGLAKVFTETDKAELNVALANYYQAHKDQADVTKTLTSIAAIANIEFAIN